LLVIVIIAFIAAVMDISLGMGFGTVMLPILILFGYQPLEVLPVLLLLQVTAGLLASVSNQINGNVDFTKIMRIKIVGIFVLSGVLGAVFGAWFANNIMASYLKLVIGLILIIAGIFFILRKAIFKNKVKSYVKIISASIIAAFSKAAAGVYGPIVTPGQIISGIKPKSAVAITIFSEAVISLAGFFSFFYLGAVNLELYAKLFIPLVLAAVFGSLFIKILPKGYIKKGIGFLIIVLGMIIIIRSFFN